MTYDWTKMNLVPRAALEAWHQYEPGVSADGAMYDYSGHDRHLAAATNKPVLTDGVINEQPGWYFDGTRNPLAWSGSVTLKHVFIVASFEDTTFPTARGLMSGLTTGNILSTEGSGNEFADTGASQYSLFGETKPPTGQIAPVAGTVGVIEVVYNAGVAMDGIQIGKKLATSEKHKGNFFEAVSFSDKLTEFAVIKMYQYFAMRYHIWQQGEVS